MKPLDLVGSGWIHDNSSILAQHPELESLHRWQDNEGRLGSAMRMRGFARAHIEDAKQSAWPVAGGSCLKSWAK